MMEGFSLHLRNRKLSAATVELYVNYAQAFERWLALEGLEVELVAYPDMLAYIDKLRQKGLAVKSINGQIRAIRQYYDFLESRKQIQTNPATNLVLKGQTRAVMHQLLTEEQLQAIYESYPVESLSGHRNKLMLSLIVYQGLVLRELEKLELNHIRGSAVEIPASSGANSRILQLGPKQLDFIEQYLNEIRPKIIAQSGEASEHLILTLQGSKKLKNPLASMMKQLRRKHPGLNNASQLRQSRIRIWLEKYDLRTVQYMAGHKYISSTERYAFEDMKDLKQALGKYHPLG